MQYEPGIFLKMSKTTQRNECFHLKKLSVFIYCSGCCNNILLHCFCNDDLESNTPGFKNNIQDSGNNIQGFKNNIQD
jgi:hypothetical protein